MSEGLIAYLTRALVLIIGALLPIVIYTRIESWEFTLLAAFATLLLIVVPFWVWWYRRQAAESETRATHANPRR